jgi:8-oxo-dGTP diphosphatase
MGSPAGDPRAPYVRLAVVGLIRRDAAGAGLWLLLRRDDSADIWDPPGGRMEADEDLTTAVTREVAEETGLDVEVAGPCYSFLTYYKEERLLAVSMACRVQGDAEAVTLEAGCATDWRWVSGEEWEDLARAGKTSWDPWDVRRASRLAAVLFETEV